MTMIDDDRLSALFAQAAAAFDVPPGGVTQIVERANATSRWPSAGGRER